MRIGSEAPRAAVWRVIVVSLLLLLGGGWTSAQAAPRNVLLFVADGLRAGSVTREAAPTLWALAQRGVSFPNSHSEYPTLTTVNASAIATGHLPGDTGEFGNSLQLGYLSACQRAGQPVGPIGMLENNCLLAELNAHHGGNYLQETSVLAAAAAQGFSTAVIGKLGPTAIQDVPSAGGQAGSTIVIDDLAGRPGGVPVAPEILAQIREGEVAASADEHAARRPQAWFTDIAVRVLLPRFKQAGRPFALVYWCRDPDATQHVQNDSPGSLVPGINGPSSLAAVRVADQALAALLAALKAQGLDQTTDVIVTADHGFSTVDNASRTSPSAKRGPGAAEGEMPAGFVARDLARALGLPLYAPTAMNDPARARPLDPPGPASAGSDAILGPDPAAPEVLIAANSGTDLIYLPTANARALAPRIAAALQAQDYTGGVFVRDDLGPVPGTLPTSAIGFEGSARLPKPALVLTMRSFVAPGCTLAEDLCSALVADSGYHTGNGTHGSFGRGETHNFMAAAGPSFKAGYVDPAPVGNADWGITMARLLGLDLKPKGRLTGRVLTEALRAGRPVQATARTLRSAPGPGGLVMTLNTQSAGGRTYRTAGGYPGRAMGLKP